MHVHFNVTNSGKGLDGLYWLLNGSDDRLRTSNYSYQDLCWLANWVNDQRPNFLDARFIWGYIASHRESLGELLKFACSTHNISLWVNLWQWYPLSFKRPKANKYISLQNRCTTFIKGITRKTKKFRVTPWLTHWLRGDLNDTLGTIIIQLPLVMYGPDISCEIVLR